MATLETRAIENTEDTLDVRDIMARVEFLESGDDVDQGAGSEDQQELVLLRELLDDLKGNGGDEEWRGAWYPITLVRDSYFQQFAEDEAESLGLMNDPVQWPYNHIDWEAAAQQLQMDYSEVDFGGETYWYR